ncbi:hypothetical protein DINM_004868 [Dirofilaria immitis]|nr:hypothetical protein [Dirofilaria immitis]
MCGFLLHFKLLRKRNHGNDLHLGYSTSVHFSWDNCETVSATMEANIDATAITNLTMIFSFSITCTIDPSSVLSFCLRSSIIISTSQQPKLWRKSKEEELVHLEKCCAVVWCGCIYSGELFTVFTYSSTFISIMGVFNGKLLLIWRSENAAIMYDGVCHSHE